MSPLMELTNVVKTFSTEPPVRPIDDLSLTIPAGQIAAVTGVSGKGKSTLLNIMGALLHPDAGSVKYKGIELVGAPIERINALHRQGIGFVFQSPHLFQALTARENLEFAAKASRANRTHAQIEEALADFGLLDRADHLPAELSVGQRRRIVLARTLLMDHEIILADEPTNDLDPHWSDYVFERFRLFVQDGNRSVVVVTHDERYARLADVVYVLDNGKLSNTTDLR